MFPWSDTGRRAPEDECPASPNGHFLFASRLRGLWVCKNCKQAIQPYGGK